MLALRRSGLVCHCECTLFHGLVICYSRATDCGYFLLIQPVPDYLDHDDLEQLVEAPAGAALTCFGCLTAHGDKNVPKRV